MKTIPLYNYETMAKFVKKLYEKEEYDLAFDIVYTTYSKLFDLEFEEIKKTLPVYLDRSGSDMIKKELQFLLDRIKPRIRFVD